MNSRHFRMENVTVDAVASRAYDDHVKGSSIEGLWVILVADDSGKTPMLARAGNGLYLLAFRTGFTARKFITDGQVPAGAEPRMVVGANLQEVLASVAGKDVQGVLIDYDYSTNTYKEAGLMY
jgi:hypothetical protein